ncbi:DUF7253 family protein [Ileibacterium valens]|uniref:DUF7253 domain-containing protein n=1 Tax=Ileibacterium valens TaxID=1862668 RepID=A0A1U7NHL3_9FIRM|nr:hypothetical protein BO224_06860 [Erysipelotrichaceae bacterium NYU-BL-E8]OLU39983.1 hypothetical protein BM735_06470 [Erysipelotrichaceae bacterium NYU-BL-F16]OLU41310.1 hypothetical protein BO222_03560 [Ileibacterium valens]
MKYYGRICFSETVETSPGVWTESYTIRNYFGDVVRRSSRYTPGQSINDNISITNDISIVADQFALNNFYNIRWIEFANSKWKITSVEVEPPRLILSIGELFNDD